MSLRQIWTSWCNFWFVEASPIPIALFRIAMGLLVIVFYWWISPEATTFFGQHAIATPETVARLQSSSLDLLTAFSVDDFWLRFTLKVLLVCGICLTFGVFSRLCAFVIYLIILSLDSRNHFVLNSGIGIMCYLCLFLVISRCGEALSVKRLVSIWALPKPDVGAAQDGSVLAQRLIQVQLCLIYWGASCWKLNGQSWLDGSAIFYTTHLVQFQRFTVPYVLDHMWTSRLLTWFTLLFETTFPFLVWIKEFRYPLLLIGAIFHLGMDWVLVIPLFQEVMLCCYICFIDPADLGKCMTLIKKVVHNFVKKPLLVVYNAQNNLSIRVAETLRRLDIFDLLLMKESNEPLKGVYVQSDEPLNGLISLRKMAVRLPLLCPLVILFWVPGFELVFKAVASNLARAYCKDVA